jgi:serine/threonine protein phosphatase PrpC
MNNRAKTLKWSSANNSHVGMVRKVNEDACLVMPDQGLWAVADGMGGHEAGDFASQLIINTLSQMPSFSTWEGFIEAAQTQLTQSNHQLRKESARHYHNRTIGSTVVVMLAHENQGACLWVGDSRLYRLRHGELEQLTRDHSHVQELVDQGLLSQEEAQEHPLGNVITRAVGSSERLDIDSLHFPLEVGDIFLLCTDGLNKVVKDSEIAYLMVHAERHEIVETLIQTALARGATDNVTVVVISIEDE